MKKKLLIIDDNEGDRVLIREAFIDKGAEFEIIMAETGEEGVELAQANNPEIIITDTNLPGIDGFEACKRIKEMEGINTKVVVMTGVIDSVDALKAKQMGADEYCVKTSDCEELINIVESFTNGEHDE